MSEASTSDIDCNDLLNQMGLGTNENKDENNKKDTKKRKKVRLNKNPTQNSKKNKAPLVNLSEFINPKKSDFELDDDDVTENSLSNQQKNILNDSSKNQNTEVNDNEGIQNSLLKAPQNINSQISADYDDIRSYSSTNDNNDIKIDDKNKLETQENDQFMNNPEAKVDEAPEIENVFNIDSDSNSDDKKEKQEEQTESIQINEKEIEKQSDKEEDKKLDSNNENNNPKSSKKKANNKSKKNIARINLSQYFDSQSQNSNNDFPLDNNIKKNDTIQDTTINKKEIPKEEKNIRNKKLNQRESEIERRISDYLNLSIKKVISDFTAELSALLARADSFDENIRQYISDFKKSLLDSIILTDNDSNTSNLLLSQNMVDFSSSTDEFKEVFRDINNFIPFKPENYISSLSECQSKIQSTQNFINGHISPLISEMHNEVYKSSKRVKLKVRKFKLNRQKFLLYDKLYDLEKRELEYQIESRISEIKRKGFFYTKPTSPVSPSVSFYEEDSITDRMREFSLTPTKDDLFRELESIIKLLKVRRKKTTTNMNLNLSMTSIADSSLSTSFFPISPSSVRDEFQIHDPSSGKQYYYSKVIKDIAQTRDESRSLRQSFQRKIQEFSSASSLMMMQFQYQRIQQQQQQQQALAASISLLQTNPQNYFTKTVPQPAPNDTNLNINNNTILNTNLTNNLNTNLNRNSRTSSLLQIANEDDIENEELLSSLRQQADEMNRKMVDELNSTTAFIKKISRGTRRHSVSHNRHHHRHHRHSRIAPAPIIQRGKLELSSDISLSNMSDDNRTTNASKIEKKRSSRSSLDSQKLQIRKKDRNVQENFDIKKQQDVIKHRKSSHVKH